MDSAILKPVTSTDFFCAGKMSRAKIVVVGHDRRLQASNTLATYPFFGDYFFRPIPMQKAELAKYRLAEAVYSYIINDLIDKKYSTDEIILTNLCNSALPHAPKGRTTYIPENYAQQGINKIKDILSQSEIQVIFAMSEQVNYWLQKLALYPIVPEFVSKAQPNTKGTNNNPQYYKPIESGAFTQICCKRYTANTGQIVFPVLHIKNWPLRGNLLKAYSKAYEDYQRKEINDLF